MEEKIQKNYCIFGKLRVTNSFETELIGHISSHVFRSP